ncbi:MAG TPA: OB-fold domain-containing protein [Candidatus Bathyarchaeia archaeon]|nr:OB-fold domain-containing protein [Candidatus Bathyarchaeia archaeon]
MRLRPEFPLPDVDWEETREFWAAAARGELCVPRCAGCARLVWYPEKRCRVCGRERFTWARMSGRGRLFSWSVVRHAFLPQFAAKLPYVAGLVALEEDPAVRIVSNLIDCAPEELTVDMPVEVVFRPLEFAGVQGRVLAPMFRPVEPGRRR